MADSRLASLDTYLPSKPNPFEKERTSNATRTASASKEEFSLHGAVQSMFLKWQHYQMKKKLSI